MTDYNQYFKFQKQTTFDDLSNLTNTQKQIIFPFVIQNSHLMNWQVIEKRYERNISLKLKSKTGSNNDLLYRSIKDDAYRIISHSIIDQWIQNDATVSNQGFDEMLFDDCLEHLMETREYVLQMISGIDSETIFDEMINFMNDMKIINLNDYRNSFKARSDILYKDFNIILKQYFDLCPEKTEDFLFIYWVSKKFLSLFELLDDQSKSLVFKSNPKWFETFTEVSKRTAKHENVTTKNRK